MNQETERLEIPNWFRSLVGAFSGGVVGGVLIWRYVGSVPWALVGFTLGCLVAYILPQPIVFGQKLKLAWRKAISLREKECPMTCLWFLAFLSFFCPVACGLTYLMYLTGDSEAPIRTSKVVQFVGAPLVLMIFPAICVIIVFFTSSLTRDEKKRVALRFNLLTTPVWSLWLVGQILKWVGIAIVATPKWLPKVAKYCWSKAISFGKFLYHFAYHTFALTGENCRLVAVAGAALGMLYGAICQSNPLTMGGIGGAISLAISGISWLVVRVLPVPTPAPQPV